MITLPPQFIEHKYPGYFFNVIDNRLYSIKIDGILKPLRSYSLFFVNNKPVKIKHYQISHKGKRKHVTLDSLMLLKMKHPSRYEIPVKKE